MFDQKNIYLEKNDPWEFILAPIDFVVKITSHTMLRDMYVQTVCVCNTILNTTFVSDWGAIRRDKQ